VSPLACESSEKTFTMWIVLGRLRGLCRCLLWLLFLAIANAAGPQSDRSAEEPVGHVPKGVISDGKRNGDVPRFYAAVLDHNAHDDVFLGRPGGRRVEPS